MRAALLAAAHSTALDNGAGYLAAWIAKQQAAEAVAEAEAEAVAADCRSCLAAEQKLRLAAEGALTQLQESHKNLVTAHAAAQAAAAAELEKLHLELLTERRRLHTYSVEATAREERLAVQAATATAALQELQGKLRSAETTRGIAQRDLERERTAHSPRRTPRAAGIEASREVRTIRKVERSQARVAWRLHITQQLLGTCQALCAKQEQELAGLRGRAAGRGKQLAGAFVVLQPLRTPSGHPLARTLAFLRRCVKEANVSFDAVVTLNVLIYQMHFGGFGTFINDELTW